MERAVEKLIINNSKSLYSGANHFIMKNIFVYYLAILVPLAGILYLMRSSSEIGVWLFLVYVIVYRPITDGARLVQKGIIKWKEVPKLFIPWFFADVFKELYFKK